MRTDKMTKKDYIKLAEVFSKHNLLYHYAITALFLDIVRMLEEDNPNFNAEKFMIASGYQN